MVTKLTLLCFFVVLPACRAAPLEVVLVDKSSLARELEQRIGPGLEIRYPDIATVEVLAPGPPLLVLTRWAVLEHVDVVIAEPSARDDCRPLDVDTRPWYDRRFFVPSSVDADPVRPPLRAFAACPGD